MFAKPFPGIPAVDDVSFMAHAGEVTGYLGPNGSDLVLLDEPFSGLDVGSALVIRSLIQELAARGKVVVFSSHEPKQWSECAPTL
jgi:ABC-type multidrug transport system ATPase subunit